MQQAFVDLHCHLEAAADIRDLSAFIEKHKVDLPSDPAELKKVLISHGRPGDLVSFLQPFFTSIYKLYPTAEAVKEFTRACVKAAADENLWYRELRFSPFYMAGAWNGGIKLDPETVVQAVIEGRDEAAAEYDIDIGLILIVERTLPVEDAQTVANLAVKYRDSIAAIDLAGPENYDSRPAKFAEVFRMALSHGIPNTIHAGEAGPAEFIEEAVEQCGAVRIGHGIAAGQDREVRALLRDREIHVETCPKSNWLTGAVKHKKANHPLLRLHREGVSVSINTDDPMIQRTRLHDDVKAARTLGAAPLELFEFQRNAIEAAFLNEEKRSELLARLREEWNKGTFGAQTPL